MNLIKVLCGERMGNLKQELIKLIENTMIPESESYLEELHQLIEDNTINQDDMEAIKDIESFLVQLQNVLLAIEENKMTDEQIEEVYGKMNALLDENEE